MSNPENGQKGGFLRRLFQKDERTATLPSRNESGEIVMTQSPDESAPGRRLPKSKSVLVIAVPDAAVKRWKKELESAGYGVECVESGPRGLDILYGFSFDALLIDDGPEINGLDLLRQIRAQDELKGLFIGVCVRDMAGRVNQEMAALDAGANRVFQRGGVKHEEILTALKTALFPRVLSAQPRSKQTAASALPDRSALAAPAAPLPAPTGDETPSADVAASSVAPARTISLGSGLPATSAAPGVSPVNKKILIIDADESVVGIYRSQIEAAGYEVEVALDGETGFHDMYTQSPDALLLDLLLPGGLSGSEILKKTRAQKKFEKLPVLVFTNIYTRDVEEEAKAAGVLRLFNKAAATPRDVVAALNEIFLPSGAVLGNAPQKPIKFDLPPLVVPAGSTAQKVEARPAAPGRAASDDGDFQEEIRESLLQGAPEFVKTLRGLLQVLLRSQGNAQAQSVQLLELYTRVHSLTGNAAIAGFKKVARLAGALEAMLREFQAKPEGLNPSTKRTLTQAVDFLAMLFTNAGIHETGEPLQEQILVVDDEIISRRVIGHSLEKAGLRSTAVSHPDEALKLLQDQRYDLVFLDVEMPGMNGFELCKKLRAMPLHAKTPVIFVTALSGFESRAKSSLSGGDDFIGKPFSYIELAVKGLIYVLRGTLGETVTPGAGAPTARLAAATAGAGINESQLAGSARS